MSTKNRKEKISFSRWPQLLRALVRTYCNFAARPYELKRGHQASFDIETTTGPYREKMSNFNTDSSVSIDQDFFDSGYAYAEQKEQPYGGYSYNQQYSDYGQTAQQVPTYNYPPVTNTGFYDSSSYDYGGNLSYDYGASGPTTMGSGGGGGYGIEGSMRPRQTSEDYTSFEDEPPLLEGNNVAKCNGYSISVCFRINGVAKENFRVRVLLSTYFVALFRIITLIYLVSHHLLFDKALFNNLSE